MIISGGVVEFCSITLLLRFGGKAFKYSALLLNSMLKTVHLPEP